MLRTQVMLSEDERVLLDGVAAETGRSMGSLIREAVRAQYGPRATDPADVEAVNAAFGAWGPNGPDGATWVDGLRSGQRVKRSG